MAGPITWRNVGTTVNSSGVGSLVENARRSGNDAFASLQKVLSDRQATEAKNFETVKDNNTADYLSQLASFGSNEEFQAARESGQLADQLSGYGRQIDRRAATEALFNQGSAYRDRDTSRDAFADTGARRDQRDTVAKMRTAAANGETEKAWGYQQQLQIDQGKYATELQDSQFKAEDQQFQRNGDRRAGAQLALSQQNAARQQQVFQRQQQEWGRADTKRENLEGANDLIQATLEGYQESQNRYLRGTEQVMKDLNLSGSVTSLKEDDQAKLAAELKRRGFKAPASFSDVLQSSTADAAKLFDLTPQETVQYRTQGDNLWTQYNSGSTVDQNKATNLVAAEKRSLENQLNSNPYASDPRKPRSAEVATTNKMVDERYDADPWFEGIWPSASTITDKLDVYRNKGVDIGGGQFVKLSEPAIQQVIRLAGEGEQNDLDTLARDIAVNNSKQLIEAEQLSKSFQDAATASTAKGKSRVAGQDAKIDFLRSFTQ